MPHFIFCQYCGKKCEPFTWYNGITGEMRTLNYCQKHGEDIVAAHIYYQKYLK